MKTTTGGLRAAAIVLGLILSTLPAVADDFDLTTDATIDGVSWNLGPTNLYVGSNSVGVTLIITNAGTVISSTNATIGATATAAENAVIVTGPGSIWTNTGYLYVGGSGFGNSLTVTDGGQLSCGVLAAGNIGGISNSINFINAGNVACSGLVVGLDDGSSSNSVNLVNSTVNIGGGGLSWGSGLGSSDNTISVDANSTITNIGSLFLCDDNTTFYMTNSSGGYALNGFTTDQMAFNTSLRMVVGLSGSVGTTLVISNYALGPTGANSNIGNGASSNSNTVNVLSGGVWNVGGQIFRIGSGAQGCVLNVNGGIVTNAGVVRVGQNAGSEGNNLTIANGGKFYSSGEGQVGSFVNNNTVDVLAGGLWNMGSFAIVVGRGSDGNVVTVNGGIVTNVGMVRVGQNSGSDDNSLTITNGGKIYSSGAAEVGSDGNYNTVDVLADGLWNVGGQTLLIGLRGAGNVVTVNGGIVTNVTTVTVGQAAAGLDNNLTIANGGKLYSSGESIVGLNTSGNTVDVVAGGLWDLGGAANLFVGSGAGNTMTLNGGTVTNVGTVTVGRYANSPDNSLTIANGGLLECIVGIIANAGYVDGNTVTNFGGILQFVNASPTITINLPASGNAIIFTDATLSYRGIQSGTLPNIRENAGATGVGKFTWQGTENIFRLDNSKGTNSTPTTPYVLSSSLGAKNYACLEMINGSTIMNDMVVADDGSILFSNTTATILGPFTNSGTMTVVDSTVNFASDCVLDENSTIEWAGNDVSGNAVTVGGTLTLPAALTFDATGAGATIGSVLFTAPSGISGSPDDWTVLPSGFHVERTGDSLVLAFGVGTVIKVR